MRVFVDVLSAVFQGDFDEKLYDAIKVLKKLEEQNKALDYFKTVIKYIIEADAVDVNFEDVEKIVEKVSKEKGEEVMSIANELKKEGKRERDIEVAKNLLREGIDIDVIKRSVELSKEKIKELQKGMKH